MPHPERACEPVLGSGDGLLLFKSVVHALAHRGAPILAPPAARAVTAGQPVHDRARFEQRELLAVRARLDQHRNLAVGIEREEPRLALLALTGAPLSPIPEASAMATKPCEAIRVK